MYSRESIVAWFKIAYPMVASKALLLLQASFRQLCT